MKLKKVFNIIMVIAVLLTLSYVFFSVIRNNIVDKIDEKHSERFLAFAIADEFRHTSMNLTRFGRTYAATGEQKYWDDYWYIVNWRGGNIERPDTVHKELYPGEKIQQREIMKIIGFTDAEFEMLNEISNMSNDLINLETQAMESIKAGKIVDGPVTASSSETVSEFAIRILYDDIYHREVYKIWGTVEEFVEILDDRIFVELSDLNNQAQIINNISMIILMTIVLGVIGLIVYLLRTVLNKHLGGEPMDIADTVKKISNGFLNMNFNKENPKGIYASMKQMVTTLSEIVGIVSTGSEQIVAASSQLAEGNQDLSTRTEQQATALEETSAAIEEMNSSIRSNADNTITANKLSRDVSDKADEGSDAVNQMIKSMNEISDSSNRISDIIDVINNIAFQTNLLALNASIEAARAGEQGKGFAVVAVEVRKLAKRSDKAAAEIAGIIKSSNKKVSEGVNIANTAGEMLSEINNAVKKVTILIGEISASSQEQLSSVDQIDQTLSSLDENTQKNASLVEEAAASTEELSAQAIELNRNMQFFKLKKNVSSTKFSKTKEISVLDETQESRIKKDSPEIISKEVKSENRESVDEFYNMVDEDEFKEF